MVYQAGAESGLDLGGGSADKKTEMKFGNTFQR